MKHLKVNLWGNEIGCLVWEPNTRRIYFAYNPDAKAAIPDIAPLLSPIAARKLQLPIYGDDRQIYQGLPPFIADSLPDAWGNTLFDKWVKDNNIPRNKVTPLYKLMFIGKRGMGALEYEPYASDLTHTREVEIKSLYDIALKVLDDRADCMLDAKEEMTLQTLLAVGTSAGGRQMKAILAINGETGEIRSGQTDGLDGYDYYILKFGNESMPSAEIETAYSRMAQLAGIKMEESRLFTVEGINHFLTKRFDRKDGKKLHMQTLAAINPEARSYEDLIETCREISIPEAEIEQIFRQLVFNVMANNTDDHAKNFSFLLAEGNEWHLAPAYDVTFIFNANGTGPNSNHCLSLGGSVTGITKADLIDFAKRNDIKNANVIIDTVANAIKQFGKYADEFGIRQPWRGIIQKTLNDTLVDFGYAPNDYCPDHRQLDSNGRSISDVSFTVNVKGHYVISATIDGNRRRRFIRPTMPEYATLNQQDLLNLSAAEQINLIEMLLPPN